MNRMEPRTGPSARGPRRLLIVLFILAGAAAGLGGFTFFFARGASYLNDDPKACMNCHVMRGHFDDWNRGPHKAAATCNDCHTPKNFLGHWAIKGLNGFNHGRAFTTGNFHEPIRIRPVNKKVLLDNCFRCHEPVIARMRTNGRGEEADCSRCHRNAGH
jgi:cytochrome c nitrite reductase small subunit